MKTITASQIAEMVKGTILGDANKSCTGVSGVKYADSNTVSFVGSKKYEEQLQHTNAGIILVCKGLENAPAENRTLIVCDNVDLAFAKLSALFAEEFTKRFLLRHIKFNFLPLAIFHRFC